MVGYLYIHIPFCIKRCSYCDFCSVPYSEGLAERYVNALLKEIEIEREMTDMLRAIYIGGGTPTTLPEKNLRRIINSISERCSLRHQAEVTIEANPGTVTKEKAEALLEARINRVSIGVQSFIDRELSALGRIHSSQDAISSIDVMSKAGFNNISIDLIYGIPGQKISDWEYTLSRAIELSPQHLSCYELTLEKGTPLYEEVNRGEITMPEEGFVLDMYYLGKDMLEKNGYIHYEISNFAKPGHACIHNLNYWGRGEYLGLGAGAHSFINKKRRENSNDVSLYIDCIERGENPVSEKEVITDDEAIKELIFLGIRKTEGVFIGNITEEKREGIDRAVKEISEYGIIERKDDSLRLTRKGLTLCNEAITTLFKYL